MVSEIARFLILLFLLVDFSAMLLIAGTVIAVITMGTLEPLLKTEDKDIEKPVPIDNKPKQPKLRRVAIF